MNEIAGSEVRERLETWVRGVAPLPYDTVLGAAGLALRIGDGDGSPPSIGATSSSDSRGARLLAVRRGGAADRAGLGRDDLLLAVDNQSLANEALEQRLRAYPPGARVPFTVERHGRQEIIEVTLDPPDHKSYVIEEQPGATAEQAAIRKKWLGRE